MATFNNRALGLAKRGAMGLSAIAIATYGAIQLDTGAVVAPPAPAEPVPYGGGPAARGPTVTYLDYPTVEVVVSRMKLELFSRSILQAESPIDRVHIPPRYYFTLFDRSVAFAPSKTVVEGEGVLRLYSDTGANFTTPFVHSGEGILHLKGASFYEFHAPYHHMVSSRGTLRLSGSSGIERSYQPPLDVAHTSYGTLFFTLDGDTTFEKGPSYEKAFLSEAAFRLVSTSTKGHFLAPDTGKPTEYRHFSERAVFGISSLSLMTLIEAERFDDDEEELILALFAKLLSEEEF